LCKEAVSFTPRLRAEYDIFHPPPPLLLHYDIQYINRTTTATHAKVSRN
jgi:hypothetical protein